MFTIPGIRPGEILNIYNIDDYPYDEVARKLKKYKKRYKAHYISECAAFDIETTSIKEPDDTYSGFMYNWQWCFRGYVVMGKRWEEFQEFINRIREAMKLDDDNILVCFVHNLAFEFQFFRLYFDIERVFARDKRDVVSCNIKGIEFRCSYVLSNMSFKKLCENSKGVTFYKQGEYDYKKMRTPDTPMSDSEYLYCYCDVAGLCQCIDFYLKSDRITTLPLTSTGFVRREFRDAVQANKKNWYRMRYARLTPKLYAMCNRAFRGGNTHANPRYSGILMHNGGSYDIKSSYPHQMMKPWFPTTKFLPRSVSKFEELLEGKKQALLFEITFYGLRMRHIGRVPYIARNKCSWYHDCDFDNGRIYRGDARMTITDIDFRCIDMCYTFDSYTVHELYSSKYGYLPKEFREKLMDYFRKKEQIKATPGYDEYIYSKTKNRINSSYGMMVSSMLRDSIRYTPDEEEPFSVEISDIQESLDAYYNNRKSFLQWQQGVWVTCLARYQLEEMLQIIGDDILYCDTDSAKFVGNYDDEVEEYNKKIREADENYEVPAFVEVNGKKVYLGEFEKEDPFDSFITQGAKKYAYVTSKDKKLHITVAGLNKHKGAEYFESIGGIEKFQVGTHIPEEYSGRTISYYCDRTDIETLTIDGCTFTRGASIGITETTYTLGVTDEYEKFRTSIQEDSEVWLTDFF